MSLGYVQANDGTSKTFMVSENLQSFYWSYGLNNDDPSSQIRDTKHLFGFIWKNVAPSENQPHAIERINGDRVFRSIATTANDDRVCRRG